jgi:hypothetical protein
MTIIIPEIYHDSSDTSSIFAHAFQASQALSKLRLGRLQRSGGAIGVYAGRSS